MFRCHLIADGINTSAPGVGGEKRPTLSLLPKFMDSRNISAHESAVKKLGRYTVIDVSEMSTELHDLIRMFMRWMLKVYADPDDTLHRFVLLPLSKDRADDAIWSEVFEEKNDSVEPEVIFMRMMRIHNILGDECFRKYFEEQHVMHEVNDFIENLKAFHDVCGFVVGSRDVSEIWTQGDHAMLGSQGKRTSGYKHIASLTFHRIRLMTYFYSCIRFVLGGLCNI